MLCSGCSFLVHVWMNGSDQAMSVTLRLNLTSAPRSLGLQYLPPSLRKEAFDGLSFSLGPIQEYELLLQVAYRDSKEKRDVKNFLKLLEPCPVFGPVKIIRAKATTCESVSGNWEWKWGRWCVSQERLGSAGESIIPPISVAEKNRCL